MRWQSFKNLFLYWCDWNSICQCIFWRSSLEFPMELFLGLFWALFLSFSQSYVLLSIGQHRKSGDWQCQWSFIELFIERPSNLEAQAQTWSSYKHHNTVEDTWKLAHVRIHVERVIGLVRNKYKMLQDTVPLDFFGSRHGSTPTIDKIVTVCCALTNMCKSVVPFDWLDWNSFGYVCMYFIYWWLCAILLCPSTNSILRFIWIHLCIVYCFLQHF